MFFARIKSKLYEQNLVLAKKFWEVEMNKSDMTVDEKFYKELVEHMQIYDELSVKKIYSLFPDINTKTISWRLYKLVRQGEIHRTGHATRCKKSVTITLRDTNIYRKILKLFMIL